MSQRINITYSIKLEDLEAEVGRLLSNTLDKLEDIYSANSHLNEGVELLTLASFKNIDTLRQQLGEVDASLADISTLVSSYLNYEVQNMPTAEEETPAPSPDNGSIPADFNLTDLQDRIALFKQNMSDETAMPPALNEISD